MNNRRNFLLREAPATAFVSAAALLESVYGPGITRVLASPRDAAANPEGSIEIARFARVVTSDPTRLDGARAGRVEEYHAEDLFLETALPPTADGGYVVPVSEEGLGSIGLVWYERRPINTLELQFADVARMPAMDGVKVQAWVAASPNLETLWQGCWITLPGPIERENDRWHLRVDLKAIPAAREAVHKVRWIFPPSTEKIAIRSLAAFTDDVWDTAELRLELEHPTAGQSGEIEIYNGETLEPVASTRVKWDLSGPLRLKLRYVKKNPPPGSTRTLLWFRLPTGSYAVAVNDVLQHQYVYVPQAGLFLASGSAPASLAQYQKQIAGKKTILERVRDLPDQTLAQAMEKAHHSIQDSGPMLLSLACDNSKFILEPDGSVLRESHATVSDGLVVSFGAGRNLEFTTHLHGGWLPIPVRIAQDGGITYRQTTFVVPYERNGPSLPLAWLNRRPLGVVEYSIENSSSRPADVSLHLSVRSDWKYLEYGLADKRSAWLAENRPRLPLQSVAGGAVAQRDGKLLVFLDTGESLPLRATVEGDVLRLEGTLPPTTHAKCWAYLPRWEMDIEERSQLRGNEDLLADVSAYWVDILRTGTQIELPDPLLMNIIRASQVHGLISSRNEANGERIEQWGASTTYRALNALYYITPAMDLLGFHDFARRAIDYYSARCEPDGLLSDGYILAGLGWHLEMIWDHYLLTRDLDWLQKVSPQMQQACRWIIRQKEKTKKLDPQGNKLPEYGLTPPGVTCDWNEFNYHFCLTGYFYDGLQAATKALTELRSDVLFQLLQGHVKDFHEDILRAYHWAQARMPVNQLRNGTWVPPYPSQVPLPGPVALFFPGEDDNRPSLGCYDVELGASNLVPLGVLDANSQDVRWMLDHLEDFWFLNEGWHDYPAAASEKDWFNLGGFSKVQPNLCRVPEIYAMRDEVKPFLRAYFNFIAPINKQNLTFWEDFTPDSGAWGSMEGSSYLLLMTRLMLVLERDGDLWLAPLLTDQWLNNGMKVAVRGAPTSFGTVSYRIRSFTDRGYIEAEIDPPTRSSPKEIVIRLRHPQGRRIRTVTVNGTPHIAVDAAKEIIRLKPTTETLFVKAEY